MYTPPNAIPLNEKINQQRRVAIQGWGGTGKTTAALTFPNPVVLDFDNSVDPVNATCAGRKLEEIYVVPFYQQAFIDTIKRGSNRRDVFKSWLEQNVHKFETNQTLVLDSWTALQDEFDKAWIPVMTKRGELDEFAFWEAKQDYAREILTLLRQAVCNSVVIFHEVMETDDKGRATGKATPLMQGKFVNKLSGYFTDWVRAIAVDRSSKPEFIKSLDLTPEQWADILAFDSPIKSKTIYLWQTVSGNVANCKTKTLGLHPFVVAHANMLL